MFVKENSNKKNCFKLKENNTKIRSTAFNHGDVLYLHGLMDKSLSFQNILYFENSVSYLLNAMLQFLAGLKFNREASICYKLYLKDWFATKHYPERTFLDKMRCEKKWIIICDGTSNTQSQLQNVAIIIMKYHHTCVIYYVLLNMVG